MLMEPAPNRIETTPAWAETIPDVNERHFEFRPSPLATQVAFARMSRNEPDRSFPIARACAFHAHLKNRGIRVCGRLCLVYIWGVRSLGPAKSAYKCPPQWSSRRGARFELLGAQGAQLKMKRPTELWGCLSSDRCCDECETQRRRADLRRIFGKRPYDEP